MTTAAVSRPSRPEILPAATRPSVSGGGHSDVDLLRLVARRHAQALSQLYDRHAQMLLALSLRMLGNRPDAEDVLQEVFIYVWRRASSYAAERSSVLTWLVLITRSRTLDRIRSKKRLAVSDPHQGGDDLELEAPVSSSGDDGLQRVLTSERTRRVRQAMATLPGPQRQVLELFYFAGLTQREIAEKTGIPIGTVKSRTLLALKKLRRQLVAELEPFDG